MMFSDFADVFTALRRARKPHGLCEICHKPIETGELYFSAKTPPWKGDVDVDSPADLYPRHNWVYINIHKWGVYETHLSCQKEFEAREGY